MSALTRESARTGLRGDPAQGEGLRKIRALTRGNHSLPAIRQFLRQSLQNRPNFVHQSVAQVIGVKGGTG